MLWMRSSYMLLHGTVPLLLCVQWLVTNCTDSSKGRDLHPRKKAIMSENTHAKAALPTICAIMVGQWTDNLVVGIGNGKRAGE